MIPIFEFLSLNYEFMIFIPDVYNMETWVFEKLRTDHSTTSAHLWIHYFVGCGGLIHRNSAMRVIPYDLRASLNIWKRNIKFSMLIPMVCKLTRLIQQLLFRFWPWNRRFGNRCLTIDVAQLIKRGRAGGPDQGPPSFLKDSCSRVGSFNLIYIGPVWVVDYMGDLCYHLHISA